MKLICPKITARERPHSTASAATSFGIQNYSLKTEAAGTQATIDFLLHTYRP